ncbi:hypothetical protein DL769_009760 [Monosporascus sp. CRB-8-3]|nr:hypothetical protein DL769_009760 [Monosporascus sp. CRB-8-3]
MQYFNTWSWKPWAESTQHASHLPDPDMTHEIRSSAEADHTSIMIGHHKMESTTDSTYTGFGRGRSHVKATELRENLVVKTFLEDLLDEKIHEFQQTLTNTAQRTEELFFTQDGHIQGLKNSQQASTDILLDHIRESKTSQQRFTNALLNHVQELKTSQQETTYLVHALTQEIAKLKSTRKRTADEISGNGTEENSQHLTDEIQRLKKHNLQSKTALDKKEKEHEAIKTSFNEALREIEQLRSTDRTFTMVDDGAVISQWKELKFLIRNLAQQHFNRPIKLPLPSLQHENHFSLVSAVYPAIVKEKYHALRAHVCMVLHENSEIDRNRIRYLAGRLNEDIHQFDFSRQDPSLESILPKIITKASELAATIAQAKAEYRARGLPNGGNMMFADAWMETSGVKVTSRPGIDLMITPALVKFGNSDGENYNESTVLVKADVF